MNKKIFSIEMLKFFALILVANSHMGLLYGKYASFATGGSIGDSLFFFCSGFTLFKGRFDRFDNWYKRRIGRIYPSVFAWALVSSVFFNGHSDMKTICLHGGGWFVTCIMIFYVILYVMRKYLMKNKITPFAVYSLVLVVWYLFEDHTTLRMYSSGIHFAWSVYFMFMLLGACVGGQEISLPNWKTKWYFVLFFVSLIGYYGSLYLCSISPIIMQLQLFTVIPLVGVVLSLYKICNCSRICLVDNTRLGYLIRAVAGLCLESYIVQFALFTDKMNCIFPANILIMYLIILAVAYTTRSLGRVFAQIFRKEDFNWKEVFRLL